MYTLGNFVNVHANFFKEKSFEYLSLIRSLTYSRYYIYIYIYIYIYDKVSNLRLNSFSS